MKLDSMKCFLDKISTENKELINHYERVAMLNLLFARKLFLKPQEQSKLYFIGLLHEVGKYNNEKYESVYPEVSAMILRTHKEFEKIADVVAQCEENVDGSGYPYHLKDDDIHIYAMITNLSNKYDHYRMSGLDQDKAIAEIKKLSDIVCPKKLVSTFTKVLFSCKEVNQIYQEED